ncbi:(-)-germacrene D synthase [Vitis vinifera]|uniref:(-)-germacrene D synthase n=1 Tax=Vitis vinifera TaxID=29760 RepID=A0A438H4W4_VITVI|nr:(-)-germacrene D synthase [Vitis vinifera]
MEEKGDEAYFVEAKDRQWINNRVQNDHWMDEKQAQIEYTNNLPEFTHFRWWKDLDFATKLSFARDRLVECYFWVLGVWFEPQYLLARRVLTKVMATTSIVDDVKDVYGTFDELELFTEAIERLTDAYYMEHQQHGPTPRLYEQLS